MAYTQEFLGSSNNKDLMGVHGDVLFADPLGVRPQGPATADGVRGGVSTPAPLRSASTRSASARNERNGGYGLGYGGGDKPRRHQDNDEDPRLDTMPGGAPKESHNTNDDLYRAYMEDAEAWGPVGSFVWGLVANGRQCCSMRDRSRAEDTEAAKRAAVVGRPPAKNNFPGPGSQQPQPASRNRPNLSDEQPRTPVVARAEAARPGPNLGFTNEPEPPSVGSRGAPVDSGTSPPTIPRGLQPPSDLPEASTYGAAPNKSALQRDPFLTGSSPPEDSSRPSSSLKSPRQPEARLPASSPKGDPPPPEGKLPSRWEWPAWCLNFKSPSIEVWVLDDETSIGRWVPAQPQSRVVDKAGKDAYLCAEYNWDGEFYVQDFGPQHVRKQGEKKSVLQQFNQVDGRRSVELDNTKVFKGQELDQTKVFQKDGLEDTRVFQGKKKGAGSKDKGGGLSSFLED
eukprot:CAMPEP_0197664404 /NCGR_PEP_ID=MMETSP1338-20131121/58611_1 /TAXON_ID=43686 ORGANISM="Pelagodinium beii, Strain RCC1491" /NCGR_SAMPLE_ID=MMETSP1338 /ASSEMBLY_ACC=CAM_ASM_000754 /LENGTH=453 /DNA_ID=CAMNT_0043243031 /DNA_START=67 /DNA_END=1428 /DNA_ORIENTATION=+